MRDRPIRQHNKRVPWDTSLCAARKAKLKPYLTVVEPCTKIQFPQRGANIAGDCFAPFRTQINIRSRKKHEKCTVTHRKNINLFFQQYRMPMNTKLLTLLCASCLAQLTSAQHFTRWWNDVEAASAKDQPKTALKSLQLIRKEALRSGNTTQLLRALFTEQVMQQEIAPDSGAVMRELIERELAKEQRPVERALWLNALGRLYAERARSSWRYNDTAAVRKAHDLLLESVQHTAMLGEARTRDLRDGSPIRDRQQNTYKRRSAQCAHRNARRRLRRQLFPAHQERRAAGGAATQSRLFINTGGEEGQHSTRMEMADLSRRRKTLSF